MGAPNRRTSLLDLRIVVPLRVNLLRFVEKVLRTRRSTPGHTPEGRAVAHGAASSHGKGGLPTVA